MPYIAVMSSRPELAAVIALITLGCASKVETTQNADWQRQMKIQEALVGERRIGADEQTSRWMREQARALEVGEPGAAQNPNRVKTPQ
jgi:hypothetical protein